MGILSPVRVDSLASWLVALGCFVILSMTVGVARTLPFFMKDWMVTLNASISTVGWVPSTAFAVLSLLAPLAPVLLAYLDQRIIIAGSGVVAAVGFFIASQMKSAGALTALVAISYIGCAVMLTTGCIAVAMATNKWRPIATGIGNIGSPIAGLVLPRILMAAQGGTTGWPTGLMTIGGLFFLVPAISIFMRPPRPEKGEPVANESPSSEPPSRLRFCRGAVDFSVFRQSIFLLLLLYMAFHFGAFTTSYVFAAPYINKNVEEYNLTQHGIDITKCADCPLIPMNESFPEANAISVINVMAGGDLAGMIFYSLCMNIPLSVVSNNRFMFFIVNEIINILATATIKASDTFTTASIAFFFMGFHYGGWFVIFWTVIADIFGKDMGHASSWALCVGGISGLAIPNILTSIMASWQQNDAPTSNDYTVIWYGMAICQAAALLVLIAIAFVRARQRASVDYKKAQVNI